MVRDRGVLARVVGDGWVENVYRLQVMNATEKAQRFSVIATGLAGMAVVVAPAVVVGSAAARWVPVAVRVPPQVAAAAGAGSHAIQFVVQLAEERVGSTGSAEPAPTATVIEKSTSMVPR